MVNNNLLSRNDKPRGIDYPPSRKMEKVENADEERR